MVIYSEDPTIVLSASFRAGPVPPEVLLHLVGQLAAVVGAGEVGLARWLQEVGDVLEALVNLKTNFVFLICV